MLPAALIALAVAVLWLVSTLRRASRLQAQVDDLRKELLLACAAAEQSDEKVGFLQAAAALGVQGKLTHAMLEQGHLFHNIDGEQAARLAAERDDLFILDVRSHAEHATGHVKGCTLLPIETLEHRCDDLPRDRPMLVYCAAGGRSAAAADFLTRRGHPEVYSLVGGIGAWQGEIEG